MQYIEREIKDVKESIEYIKECIMESSETNDILFYAKMLEKYQDILKYWEGRKNV
jgi:Cft2 family RNA processing exonuclease